VSQQPSFSGDIREHETEPLLGLPEVLPVGERILWQGSPEKWAMAVRVFHLRKIVVWFVLIGAWRSVAEFRQTGEWAADILVTPVLALLIAIGIVAMLAHWYARSTIYTLTSQRIVMRFGLAVQITMNLPFRQIVRADASNLARGVGNIAFEPVSGSRVSHLVLWPNVRPWHWLAPQPMFCCIADVDRVAQLLTEAVYASNRQNVTTGEDDFVGAAPVAGT
jgi:hypothetical protein